MKICASVLVTRYKPRSAIRRAVVVPGHRVHIIGYPHMASSIDSMDKAPAYVATIAQALTQKECSKTRSRPSAHPYSLGTFCVLVARLLGTLTLDITDRYGPIPEIPGNIS